ncbi:MAG TPA: arylsulfatase [Verrucomicrobiales bacterium]|nr:arylsulfatase [Verrucomicrobiales bacterium]HRJ08697.1 arylsulfatase [Prosthecobacter sp.]HRK14030.1 arylsulfatase [Prosthecobacter sp.]
MRHLAFLLLSVLCVPLLAAKPNFVIILADDLGYGDMQVNDPERGKIATPNMDRLAAEGMRFTDGHSSSGCCSPSRYTLLTGRYHWRTTLQSGIVGLWGKPLIAPDRLTIGKLAQQHGYRTACIGKWHLGSDWPVTPEQKVLLTGFGGKSGGGGDVSTTITDAHREAWKAVFSQRIPGGPSERGFDEYFGTDVPNWPPYCFIDGDRTVGIPSELLPASKLVKNQASIQGPALADWQLEGILPALASRAEKFIQTQSAAKQPFLIYLPLTSPHTPLAVNAEWKGKSGLNSDYADLVMETDQVLGRVLDALKTAGVENDTFVLFTSDNGCASYIGVKDMEKQGHYPSGPLRDYKASVYEGGHRVPFVVRWPGVVKAGSVCKQLVLQADTLATMAEILGVKLPETAGEDSFSLMPLLKGEDRPIRTNAVNTACGGIPSYRDGAWKYVAAAEPELYNLDEDLAETMNMAPLHPERVKAMQASFEKLIRAGRSTPGAPQKNDIKVVRYPKEAAKSKAKKAGGAK